MRYTLPLLEGSAGFIKALLPWQWGLWVMSINGLRLLAAREAWEAAQQKVDAGWAAAGRNLAAAAEQSWFSVRSLRIAGG